MFQLGSGAYYVALTLIAALTLGLGSLLNYPWLGLMVYLLLSSLYILYTVYNDHATALPKKKVFAAALFALLIGTVGVNGLISHGVYDLPFGFVTSGLLLFVVAGSFTFLYLQLDSIFDRLKRG